MTVELNLWGDKTVSFPIAVPPSIVPLGTSSSAAVKSVTPKVGTTAVSNTDTNRSFWDVLGDAAGSIGATDLINSYVKGKIIKEQINDGVPVYTTQGNPNDQAGGKLLSDVNAQQKNVTRQYYLIGFGIVAVLAGLYIVNRK